MAETKTKPRPPRDGGLWISWSILRNREITDTQRCLVALVDQLTTSRKPCDRSTSELADMLVLTPERTESLLANLKSRGYLIELRHWCGKSWVARMAHPSVSSKPKTVLKHIDVYEREWGSGVQEPDRALVPLSMPS